MPHDGRLRPTAMLRDGNDVREQGVQRIILVGTPARLAEATVVEDYDLAVRCNRGSNVDPVV